MKVFNSITAAASLCLPMLANAGVMPGDEFGPDAPAAATEVLDASSQKSNRTGVANTQPRAIQFYASDKAAEITYIHAGPVFNLNNSRASVGFLFNERRDNAITGSIMYDAKSEFLTGLTLSFGSKVYAGLLGFENSDVFGLAASLEAAYEVPVQQLPLKFSAGINYAPDILTFGQSDRIIDWHVRTGLQLTKNIEGFVGFRFLQFDTRPGDRELDDRFHLGVRWMLGN